MLASPNERSAAMMDKEDILKRSRREKDEGLTYAPVSYTHLTLPTN